jgi:hypothetical protein
MEGELFSKNQREFTVLFELYQGYVTQKSYATKKRPL